MEEKKQEIDVCNSEILLPEEMQKERKKGLKKFSSCIKNAAHN